MKSPIAATCNARSRVHFVRSSSTKFSYRWVVISDQLVGEYAVVMQHCFEVNVATQDSGTIVQEERRDWVIDTGVGGVATRRLLKQPYHAAVAACDSCKSAYSGLRGSNCHSLNSLQCVFFANIAVSQNRLQIPAKKSISIQFDFLKRIRFRSPIR